MDPRPEAAPDLHSAIVAARLYAIIDTTLVPEGAAPEIAEQLVRSGVRILQYRHKGLFAHRNWDDCCVLAGLARRHGALFIVNDRADVALLCGAAGVHLGQEDLEPERARTLLGPSRIVGFSTHTLEQAREGDALPVDYLAIGPVFPTATKERPDPTVGLETVAAVRAAVRKPLVAIGGITLQNARAVVEAGADAVAVVRDLLAAPDPGQRARQFLEALAS